MHLFACPACLDRGNDVLVLGGSGQIGQVVSRFVSAKFGNEPNLVTWKVVVRHWHSRAICWTDTRQRKVATQSALRTLSPTIFAYRPCTKSVNDGLDGLAGLIGNPPFGCATRRPLARCNGHTYGGWVCCLCGQNSDGP